MGDLKFPSPQLAEAIFHLFIGVWKIINPELLNHCRRVARGSRALAVGVGWPSESVQLVHLAGLVHDLGYLAVQSEALISLAEGGEDQEPRDNLLAGDVYQNHPLLGERIMASSESLAGVRPIVRSHHEHLDGSGFPDGLKGEEIPAPARLVAVVDFFERVTAARSGSALMSAEEAKVVLEEDAGIIYDPVMVRVFLEKILPTGVMDPLP